MIYKKYKELENKYNFDSKLKNIYRYVVKELIKIKYDDFKIDLLISHLIIKINLYDDVFIDISTHILYNYNFMISYVIYKGDKDSKILKTDIDTIHNTVKIIGVITKLPHRKKKLEKLL